MQNEPNYKTDKNNVNLMKTNNYGKIPNLTLCENEPKRSQSFDYAQDKFTGLWPEIRSTKNEIRNNTECSKN